MVADDEFDLDAWIAGARLPERIVTVYGRGDLVAEAAHVRSQLDAARSESRADDRLTGPGATAGLQRELEMLQDQFEASKLEIRLKALPLEEYRAAAADLPKTATDEDATYAYMSAQVVSPGMNASQVKALRDRIGEGQWMSLIDAANGVMTDRRLDVPFSSASSGSGRTSF